MAAENPTELELLILKVLWEQSPLTARQIREVLADRGRELAHTSVITMLQRMVDKGQLDQLDPEVGKAFRFVPFLSEADVSGRMLGDLVERVFDGSAEEAVAALLELRGSGLSKKEYQRLAELIDRARGEDR